MSDNLYHILNILFTARYDQSIHINISNIKYSSLLIPRNLCGFFDVFFSEKEQIHARIGVDQYVMISQPQDMVFSCMGFYISINLGLR